MKCWGENESGQLGNGEFGEYSDVPVEVSGISTATQVSAGDASACALLASGHVKCWGDNNDGQLGNGEFGEYSDVPVEVSGISTATQVSSGNAYACALLSSGHVKCWGEDVFGELGDGTAITEEPFGSDTPVEVSGISTATQVSAGWAHVCTVLENKHVDCWGYNGSSLPADGKGQLGNGTTTSSLLPVGVSGISTATQVSAGLGHTCAVLESGHAECWGENHYGELGDGTTSEYSDVPVEVSGISTATQISAGWESTCALLASEHAKCWGENYYGQLGTGTNSNSDVPVEVSGISTATQISASQHHACAPLESGHVKCWGENRFGQLGDSGTANSNSPVEATGI